MAAEIRCPRCGAVNRPGTAYCVNCGSPLAAGGTGTAPTAPYPSAPPPAYAQTYAPPYDAERQKQIDRTRTGVLLLLIGTLLTWIPVIGVLGSLLVLIGAILVILGRKAFGAAHARNVIISIVLVFLAIIIAIVGAVVVFASTFAGFTGQQITPELIRTTFNNFLIVVVIAAVVGGLASVFFTIALQNQMGKMLLLGAYAANVIIAIATFAVAAGAMSALIDTACPGGTCDPQLVSSATFAFQGQVTALGLLSAIPSILYALAYYLVWTRIKKGEIPGPSMPPGMAPPAPMPPR